MTRGRGFTLIELMIVIAILGILATTSVPVYRTWQQRAYGSEAAIMMRQIVDGEVMYFLKHDTFFPGPGDSASYEIYADGGSNPVDAVNKVRDALNLTIRSGHHLNYSIQNLGDSCLVTIHANFPLFKNNQTYLYAVLDQDGKVQYLTMGDLAAILGG